MTLWILRYSSRIYSQPIICISLIQYNGSLEYSPIQKSVLSEVLNPWIMNMIDCNSPFKEFTIHPINVDLENSKFPQA